MITLKICDYTRIVNLDPQYQVFFDFVNSHNFDEEPLGKITIQGDDIFVMNIAPECKSQEEQVLEVHRKYIDIHILLNGNERIGWLPLSEAKEEIQAYAEDGDCALYKDKPSAYVDLLPGHCLIAYPEDAHAPVIGKGKIRKLIGKIRIK